MDVTASSAAAPVITLRHRNEPLPLAEQENSEWLEFSDVHLQQTWEAVTSSNKVIAYVSVATTDNPAVPGFLDPHYPILSVHTTSEFASLCADESISVDDCMTQIFCQALTQLRERSNVYPGVTVAHMPGCSAEVFSACGMVTVSEAESDTSAVAGTSSSPTVWVAMLPRPVRRVTVYCGSAMGSDPDFETAAIGLIQQLQENDLTLVYGGGNIGLMGTIGNTAHDKGVPSIGVITRYLKDKEILCMNLDEVDVVETMAERKTRMVELGDAYVALPGGIGTIEELTEVITNQLLVPASGPVVLINTNGYWKPFVDLLQHMATHGFIAPRFVSKLIVIDDPSQLMDAIHAWVPPVPKWVAGRLVEATTTTP